MRQVESHEKPLPHKRLRNINTRKGIKLVYLVVRIFIETGMNSIKKNIITAVAACFVVALLLPNSLFAQNTETPFVFGITYYRQGEFKKAIRPLQQAVIQKPDNINAHKLLTSAYLKTGQFKKAVTAAQNGLNIYPDNIQLLLLKAEAYYNSDYMKAIPVYQEIISLIKKTTGNRQQFLTVDQAQAYIGYLYQRHGNELLKEQKPETAINYFKKALKTSPDSTSIYNNLAYVLIEQKKFEEALEVLDKAVVRFPNAEKLLYLQGQAYRGTNQIDKMTESFHQLYIADSTNVNYAIIYGQALLMSKEIRKANAFFQELIKKYPQNKALYEVLVKIDEMRYDFTAKKNILKLQRKAFPKDNSVTQELAETYVLLEEYDKARQVYDSLATVTGEVNHFLQSARTWLYAEKMDKAVEAYRSLIQQWPKNPAILYEAGLIFHKVGEDEEAIQAFKKAYSLKTSPQILIPYIQILLKRDSVDLAFQYIPKLRGTAYSGIGKLYELIYKFGDIDQPAKIEKTKQDLLEIFERYESVQKGFLTQTKKRINARELGNPPVLSDERVLERLGSFVDMWYVFLTDTYSYKTGLKIIQDMISEYPASSKLYFFKGRLAFASGDFNISRKALEKTVELGARDSKTFLTLGNTYLELDMIHQAILSFERALTLNPRYEKAYQQIIAVSQKNKILNQLCARWLRRYKNNRQNKMLRDYLIVALQKANRFKDAKSIIDDA